MHSTSLKALLFSCVLVVACGSAPPKAVRDTARLGYSCSTYRPERGLYVSQISSEAARKTPLWDPRKDLLPLLPHDADQIAWRKLNAMIADGRIPRNEEVFRPGWEHERTQLVDLGDGMHWAYLVEFYGKTMLGIPPVVQILITLDGKPVEPELMYTKKP